MTTVGTAVPAPQTGVHFGTGTDGPLSLRLFRPVGTTIAALSGVQPARLIALRAAMGGSTVRVISSRPQVWTPVLRFGADARVAPPGAAVPVTAGPMLIVDDRPSETRSLGEAGEWQCRVDVRTPWTPADMAAYSAADVLLVSMLSAEMAAVVGSMFGLGQAATALTTLRPDLVGVVTRGRLKIVTTPLSAAEAPVLRSSG